MGLFCKGFTILHTNQNSPSKAGKTPEESGRILFWNEATGSNLFDMNLLRRNGYYGLLICASFLVSGGGSLVSLFMSVVVD